MSADVMMVWHAYMLNPRSFLEDCIRHSKMSFWATGFPWSAIDECITTRFVYEPGRAAQAEWEKCTGLSWDILDASISKTFACPRCQKEVVTAWTIGHGSDTLNDSFKTSYGYADKAFHCSCPYCQLAIEREQLKIAKFREDIEALQNDRRPMPGSLFNEHGMPEQHTSLRQPESFPNRFVAAALQDLLRETDLRLNPTCDMTKLRSLMETKLKDRDILRVVGGPTQPGERIAFRRMMSRYWENESPFALDLVGAVIRQGTFIQKMDKIDWIHSPALMETMKRLIRKYQVFFGIMASFTNRKQMAVPTLDVDLAWHTHQLAPYRYFAFSRAMTRKKTFIDHDDKVDEGKLSDGFRWTTKMYKKVTDGEIYSECTCWYCEATREPILSSVTIFKDGATAKARAAAEALHSDPRISDDPERNPHISAHNAVRIVGKKDPADSSGLRALRLKTDHQKALRRAEKRKRARGSTSNHSDDYYLYYGQSPAPYMCDPYLTPEIYVANPACMDATPGAYGNCVSGTCGARVASGACGGGGGTCSGGCNGKVHHHVRIN